MFFSMAIICIPVLSNEGLLSQVCPHFGKAPMYLLWQGRQLAGTLSQEPTTSHGGHSCIATEVLTAASVSKVVCNALGRGAMNRMHAAGIEVFITAAGCVGDVLDELDAGIVMAADASHCCEGHHHD
jgi:predicted Fe-Mo cluster-binding NifX family protein